MERTSLAAFNKAREQEYCEIIAGCGEVLAGIEALTAAGQFPLPRTWATRTRN